MRVLGIETSCDETGVAIYDDQRGIIAHELYSQVELHARYGGVVPELASRDHIRKLLPLVDQVLHQSGIAGHDLDGIAYTKGPGLVGALLVGAALGRTLAWAWRIPAYGVHHLEAHLLAPMLETPAPTFPFLALLASGGHTMLVDVHAFGKYTILGETLDDAAGEAFDKTAKMLNLGYPGGPAVAKLAQTGNPDRFRFPRPMTDRPGLDFSFSGLKTFTYNTRKKNTDTVQNAADIARAFEDAVVDTFIIKCRRALEATGLKQLVIAGGVGANQQLRSGLTGLANKLGVDIFYPRAEYCTDNGAMVALCGWLHLKEGHKEDLSFDVVARWPLDKICPK